MQSKSILIKGRRQKQKEFSVQDGLLFWPSRSHYLLPTLWGLHASGVATLKTHTHLILPLIPSNAWKKYFSFSKELVSIGNAAGEREVNSLLLSCYINKQSPLTYTAMIFERGQSGTVRSKAWGQSWGPDRADLRAAFSFQTHALQLPTPGL